MKKISLSLIVLTIAFCACQKNDAADSSNNVVTSLSASKTTVSKNETVSLNITNAPSGNVYSKWSTSPATGATIDQPYSNNNRGSVTFTQPGTYTISAEMRSVHPSCAPSPGYDTCYTSKPLLVKPTVTITVTN